MLQLVLAISLVLAGCNQAADQPVAHVTQNECSAHNDHGGSCTAECRADEKASCINGTGDEAPRCACERPR